MTETGSRPTTGPMVCDACGGSVVTEWTPAGPWPVHADNAEAANCANLRGDEPWTPVPAPRDPFQQARDAHADRMRKLGPPGAAIVEVPDHRLREGYRIVTVIGLPERIRRATDDIGRGTREG